MGTLTKKFTATIAALNTDYNMTDDDTGETTLILDRDADIIDVVGELPPAATQAARYTLNAPPRGTGYLWHLQEINPATAGRVRKPPVGLKAGRKYQMVARQTVGAVLSTSGNIIVTIQER